MRVYCMTFSTKKQKKKKQQHKIYIDIVTSFNYALLFILPAEITIDIVFQLSACGGCSCGRCQWWLIHLFIHIHIYLLVVVCGVC